LRSGSTRTWSAPALRTGPECAGSQKLGD